jgi:hypothetical protein
MLTAGGTSALPATQAQMRLFLLQEINKIMWND